MEAVAGSEGRGKNHTSDEHKSNGGISKASRNSYETESTNKEGIFAVIDRIIPDWLISFLSTVPLLLYILSPAIDAYVCWNRKYVWIMDRVIYHDIVGYVLTPISVEIGIFVIIVYLCKLRSRGIGIREFFKNNIPFVCFLILLILMTISTFLNGATKEFLLGNFFPRIGLFSNFIYFGVYFFLASIMHNIDYKKMLCMAFTIVSLVIAAYGVWFQIAFADDPAHAFSVDIFSVYYNSNHYGYFLSIAIALQAALFVGEKKKFTKIFYLVSFLCNTTILMFNNTFGAWLADLFAIILLNIVYFILDKKINKLAVLSFVLYIAVLFIVAIWHPVMLNSILYFFGADVSLMLKTGASDAELADKYGGIGSGRMRLWIATLKYISEKPWFGFAADGVSQRLNEEAGSEMTHNEFLMYAVFYGIPAAIVYTIGCFSVFLHGLKNKAKLDYVTIACIIGAFGYLVSSFVGNMYFYSMPFLCIFLGLAFSVQGTGVGSKVKV